MEGGKNERKSRRMDDCRLKPSLPQSSKPDGVNEFGESVFNAIGARYVAREIVTRFGAGYAAQDMVRNAALITRDLETPSRAGVASESVPEHINAEVPDGRLEYAPVREPVIPCDSCTKPSIPGKKGWMKQNGKPWTKLCSECKKGLIDRAPTAICADDPACTWWRPEWETD